jgi:hypothetical protein
MWITKLAGVKKEKKAQTKHKTGWNLYNNNKIIIKVIIIILSTPIKVVIYNWQSKIYRFTMYTITVILIII